MEHTTPSAPTTSRRESGSGTGPPNRGRSRGPGPGRAPGTARLLHGLTRPEPWKRAPVLTALALLLGLAMLLHAQIPNRVWHLGSLAESALPWFALPVPLLLTAALWRRSASATLALLLPVTVWLQMFGGLLSDKSHPGGDLTVVEQNVDADNPDPVGTARDLAASHANLLALVELTPQSLGGYETELAKTYPYHEVRGTVGLWSTLPLSAAQPIDVMDYGPLGTSRPTGSDADENRALRTTVTTARGPLTVYVAHLGSVRVYPGAGFWTVSRDIGVQALAGAVAADPGERVVLLGDLNGATDDRALAGLTSRLHSAQESAGAGFGFSYPASFPVVRIDHVLVRGLTPRSARVLPATGSDHLPVAAALDW
ncbi:endonuclease/exonuclease/phosphatase family protein [Kitasatospora sp. NPDC059648]|uniref:endonuclease/exonuclease/phosphatase family protein n=1 Tax=Kitasatospora sp. NPDC059648 TaxID=3346894 RepID=UPI00369A6A21